MAKITSERQDIYKVDGLFNSEELLVEHEDGNIDLGEILKRLDGKFVKISIVGTDELNIPFAEE